MAGFISTTFTTTTASEVLVVSSNEYISLTTYTTTNPSSPYTTEIETNTSGSSYDLILVEPSTALTTETVSSFSFTTQTFYGARPTTSILKVTTTVTSQPPKTKFSSAATPTTTPAHLSRSLSTGTKAGIGVGVTLAVLIFAAITVCAFFRTRRVRRIKTAEKQPGQSLFQKHELDSTTDLSKMYAAVELEGSAAAPMSVIKRKAVGLANNAPTVVDGKEVVHEK